MIMMVTCRMVMAPEIEATIHETIIVVTAVVRLAI